MTRYAGLLLQVAIAGTLAVTLEESESSVVHFADTELCVPRTRPVHVHNDGTSPLVISSVHSSHPAFRVSRFQPAVVQPYKEHTFSVVFTPREIGEARCTLEVVTEGDSHPVATISVVGRGVRNRYGIKPAINLRVVGGKALERSITLENPDTEPFEVHEIASTHSAVQILPPVVPKQPPNVFREIADPTGELESMVMLARMRAMVMGMDEEDTPEGLHVHPAEIQVTTTEDGSVTFPSSMWVVKPNGNRTIAKFQILARKRGQLEEAVQLRTNRGLFSIPVSAKVETDQLALSPEEHNFGFVTPGSEHLLGVELSLPPSGNIDPVDGFGENQCNAFYVLPRSAGSGRFAHSQVVPRAYRVGVRSCSDPKVPKSCCDPTRKAKTVSGVFDVLQSMHGTERARLRLTATLVSGRLEFSSPQSQFFFGPAVDELAVYRHEKGHYWPATIGQAITLFRSSKAPSAVVEDERAMLHIAASDKIEWRWLHIRNTMNTPIAVSSLTPSHGSIYVHSIRSYPPCHMKPIFVGMMRKRTGPSNCPGIEKEASYSPNATHMLDIARSPEEWVSGHSQGTGPAWRTCGTVSVEGHARCREASIPLVSERIGSSILRRFGIGNVDPVTGKTGVLSRPRPPRSSQATSWLARQQDETAYPGGGWMILVGFWPLLHELNATSGNGLGHCIPSMYSTNANAEVGTPSWNESMTPAALESCLSAHSKASMGALTLHGDKLTKTLPVGLSDGNIDLFVADSTLAASRWMSAASRSSIIGTDYMVDPSESQLAPSLFTPGFYHPQTTFNFCASPHKPCLFRDADDIRKIPLKRWRRLLASRRRAASFWSLSLLHLDHQADPSDSVMNEIIRRTALHFAAQPLPTTGARPLSMLDDFGERRARVGRALHSLRTYTGRNELGADVPQIPSHPVLNAAETRVEDVVFPEAVRHSLLVQCAQVWKNNFYQNTHLYWRVLGARELSSSRRTRQKGDLRFAADKRPVMSQLIPTSLLRLHQARFRNTITFSDIVDAMHFCDDLAFGDRRPRGLIPDAMYLQLGEHLLSDMAGDTDTGLEGTPFPSIPPLMVGASTLKHLAEMNADPRSATVSRHVRAPAVRNGFRNDGSGVASALSGSPLRPPILPELRPKLPALEDVPHASPFIPELNLPRKPFVARVKRTFLPDAGKMKYNAFPRRGYQDKASPTSTRRVHLNFGTVGEGETQTRSIAITNPNSIPMPIFLDRSTTRSVLVRELQDGAQGGGGAWKWTGWARSPPWTAIDCGPRGSHEYPADLPPITEAVADWDNAAAVGKVLQDLGSAGLLHKFNWTESRMRGCNSAARLPREAVLALVGNGLDGYWKAEGSEAGSIPDLAATAGDPADWPSFDPKRESTRGIALSRVNRMAHDMAGFSAARVSTAWPFGPCPAGASRQIKAATGLQNAIRKTHLWVGRIRTDEGSCSADSAEKRCSQSVGWRVPHTVENEDRFVSERTAQAVIRPSHAPQASLIAIIPPHGRAVVDVEAYIRPQSGKTAKSDSVREALLAGTDRAARRASAWKKTQHARKGVGQISFHPVATRKSKSQPSSRDLGETVFETIQDVVLHTPFDTLTVSLHIKQARTSVAVKPIAFAGDWLSTSDAVFAPVAVGADVGETMTLDRISTDSPLLVPRIYRKEAWASTPSPKKCLQARKAVTDGSRRGWTDGIVGWATREASCQPSLDADSLVVGGIDLLPRNACGERSPPSRCAALMMPRLAWNDPAVHWPYVKKMMSSLDAGHRNNTRKSLQVAQLARLRSILLTSRRLTRPGLVAAGMTLEVSNWIDDFVVSAQLATWSTQGDFPEIVKTVMRLMRKEARRTFRNLGTQLDEDTMVSMLTTVDTAPKEGADILARYILGHHEGRGMNPGWKTAVLAAIANATVLGEPTASAGSEDLFRTGPDAILREEYLRRYCAAAHEEVLGEGVSDKKSCEPPSSNDATDGQPSETLSSAVLAAQEWAAHAKWASAQESHFRIWQLIGRTYAHLHRVLLGEPVEDPDMMELMLALQVPEPLLTVTAKSVVSNATRSKLLAACRTAWAQVNLNRFSPTETGTEDAHITTLCQSTVSEMTETKAQARETLADLVDLARQVGSSQDDLISHAEEVGDREQPRTQVAACSRVPTDTVAFAARFREDLDESFPWVRALESEALFDCACGPIERCVHWLNTTASDMFSHSVHARAKQISGAIQAILVAAEEAEQLHLSELGVFIPAEVARDPEDGSVHSAQPSGGASLIHQPEEVEVLFSPGRATQAMFEFPSIFVSRVLSTARHVRGNDRGFVLRLLLDALWRTLPVSARGRIDVAMRPTTPAGDPADGWPLLPAMGGVERLLAGGPLGGARSMRPWTAETAFSPNGRRPPVAHRSQLPQERCKRAAVSRMMRISANITGAVLDEAAQDLGRDATGLWSEISPPCGCEDLIENSTVRGYAGVSSAVGGGFRGLASQIGLNLSLNAMPWKPTLANNSLEWSLSIRSLLGRLPLWFSDGLLHSPSPQQSNTPHAASAPVYFPYSVSPSQILRTLAIRVVGSPILALRTAGVRVRNPLAVPVEFALRILPGRSATFMNGDPPVDFAVLPDLDASASTNTLLERVDTLSGAAFDGLSPDAASLLAISSGSSLVLQPGGQGHFGPIFVVALSTKPSYGFLELVTNVTTSIPIPVIVAPSAAIPALVSEGGLPVEMDILPGSGHPPQSETFGKCDLHALCTEEEVYLQRSLEPLLTGLSAHRAGLGAVFSGMGAIEPILDAIPTSLVREPHLPVGQHSLSKLGDDVDGIESALREGRVQLVKDRLATLHGGFAAAMRERLGQVLATQTAMRERFVDRSTVTGIPSELSLTMSSSMLARAVRQHDERGSRTDLIKRCFAGSRQAEGAEDGKSSLIAGQSIWSRASSTWRCLLEVNATLGDVSGFASHSWHGNAEAAASTTFLLQNWGSMPYRVQGAVFAEDPKAPEAQPTEWSCTFGPFTLEEGCRHRSSPTPDVAIVRPGDHLRLTVTFFPTSIPTTCSSLACRQFRTNVVIWTDAGRVSVPLTATLTPRAIKYWAAHGNADILLTDALARRGMAESTVVGLFLMAVVLVLLHRSLRFAALQLRAFRRGLVRQLVMAKATERGIQVTQQDGVWIVTATDAMLTSERKLATEADPAPAGEGCDQPDGSSPGSSMTPQTPERRSQGGRAVGSRTGAADTSSSEVQGHEERLPPRGTAASDAGSDEARGQDEEHDSLRASSEDEESDAGGKSSPATTGQESVPPSPEPRSPSPSGTLNIQAFLAGAVSQPPPEQPESAASAPSQPATASKVSEVEPAVSGPVLDVGVITSVPIKEDVSPVAPPTEREPESPSARGVKGAGQPPAHATFIPPLVASSAPLGAPGPAPRSGHPVQSTTWAERVEPLPPPGLPQLPPARSEPVGHGFSYMGTAADPGGFAFHPSLGLEPARPTYAPESAQSPPLPVDQPSTSLPASLPPMPYPASEPFPLSAVSGGMVPPLPFPTDLQTDGLGLPPFPLGGPQAGHPYQPTPPSPMQDPFDSWPARTSVPTSSGWSPGGPAPSFSAGSPSTATPLHASGAHLGAGGLATTAPEGFALGAVGRRTDEGGENLTAFLPHGFDDWQYSSAGDERKEHP